MATKIEKSSPAADKPIQNPAYAKAELNKKLPGNEKIALLRQMVRIRRFEERCLRVYQQGKIGGFLHLYIGQEAVAVGCVSVMDEHDHVITAYRDHGHALAVGMGMNECMAELYGKATGCSKGKGGSMHFFAPDKRFWGGHGIVAGQTPLGLGIAFAMRYEGKPGCCLTFMGDGATNQGAYYEALGLASLWDVPVIFVIENNGYSMGTAQHRHSVGDLAKRAEGFGIEFKQCNGHDLYEVRAEAAAAIEFARGKNRPYVLEIDTYRYRGHSVADPDKTYRTKEEIKEYQETKDPLNLFRTQLLNEGVLDEEQADEIDKEAKLEAEEAANFAEKSGYPDPSSIMQDIYYEEDHRTEETYGGRMVFE